MDQNVSAAVLMRADAPYGRKATRAGPRPIIALLVAFGHVAVIAGVVVAFSGRRPAPKPDIAISVVFQPPAPQTPPLSPQIIAAAMLPTPTASVLDTLSPVAPVDRAADLRALLPRVVQNRGASRRFQVAQQAAALHRTIPDATVQAATPASTSHQVLSPTPSPHALQVWEARVHQAIQNAVVYPSAARLMRREGRTRVRFDYGHDAVSSVSVAESSGLSVLDHAALGAVTEAAIPPPPPELAGQTRSLVLWVTFSLTMEE